jgi:hypothetical protein
MAEDPTPSASWRAVWPVAGAACALTLGLICYRPVLFNDGQFAYRDAGHFYYPLYLRVQQEWSAGRLPLWSPWQNGGTPLLGMPMAAVLYPGKVIYALLPYAWAARIYVLAHEAIAFLGMLLLARSLGITGVGACLSALCYAFGAPILFQHSNVIYLVGAAWVPWGFRALDRLVRQGIRWGFVELTVVLTLQVLGGDPQAAYLTVALGAIEAAVLTIRTSDQSERPAPRRATWLLATAVLVWFAVTLGLAYSRPQRLAPAWLPETRVLVVAGWGIVGVGVLFAWIVRRSRARLGPKLGGLVGAAFLAALLSAVQLAPTWELARLSTRDAPSAEREKFDFDVEPHRLLEAVWPHVFGLEGPDNTCWTQAFPPVGQRTFWTPSIYIGGLSLVLLLVGCAGKSDRRWRAWLVAVFLLSVIGSMGKSGGPLWLARAVPGMSVYLGPHDPPGPGERSDGFPSDAWGSVYGMLMAGLPGFSLFRYPAKLMTFACAAAAVLAGLGWDRLAAGEVRPARRWALVGMIASLLALGIAFATRGMLAAWLARRLPRHPLFGPVDVNAATGEAIAGLVHASVVYGAVVGLSWFSARRPRLAGTAALLLMTADLATAGSRLVWTVPQSTFDAPPLIARLIDEAERADPAPGPFRIHRVEQWHPRDYLKRGSPSRLEEVVAWERDTVDRLYALPAGFQYTVTRGLIDVRDYNEFFDVQVMSGRDSQGVDRTIFTHPRRGYDLWTARYFLMPVDLNGWMGEDRGFARVYPPDAIANDPEKSLDWTAHEGWQLLRNQRVLPRAWLVHQALIKPLDAGRSETERSALIDLLVFKSDNSANPAAPPAFDLSTTAIVETNDPARAKAYLGGTPPEPSESVTVTRSDPQRVELRAVLDRPGLIVLADTDYPGWRLTIDGTAAPIERTNRLMRGAFVKAGTHVLVYTYRPTSFLLGAGISLGGLIALVVAAVRIRRTRGPLAGPVA